MQLDKAFIRNLIIPFNEVLPPGSLREIRDKFNVSETTPRKALTGEFYNADITKEAIKIIAEQADLTTRFLQQFPEDVLKEALGEA